MQRIIAGIVLLALFAGAGYYVHAKKSAQDPQQVYEHALSFSVFEKAIAYVQDRVEHWQPDPEDPKIRLPKNWGKSQVTIDKYTFNVYSPDETVPPRYYISFAFPKPLIKKVQLVKCWGTAAGKTTDVCIVGNDAKLEAYFQILKLLKTPDFSALAPNVEMK